MTGIAMATMRLGMERPNTATMARARTRSERVRVGIQMGLDRPPVAERNAMSGRLLRMTKPLTHATAMVAALARVGPLPRVVSVTSIT